MQGIAGGKGLTSLAALLRGEPAPTAPAGGQASGTEAEQEQEYQQEWEVEEEEAMSEGEKHLLEQLRGELEKRVGEELEAGRAGVQELETRQREQEEVRVQVGKKREKVRIKFKIRRGLNCQNPQVREAQEIEVGLKREMERVGRDIEVPLLLVTCQSYICIFFLQVLEGRDLQLRNEVATLTRKLQVRGGQEAGMTPVPSTTRRGRPGGWARPRRGCCR